MGLGKFITLEGGEGSGKSTLLRALALKFRERGLEIVETREPGGTPLAEAVRELALHPPEGENWSPLAQALLMNTAREDHIRQKIRPALEIGAWVICDRFADSTRVYQSIDGVAIETLLSFEAAIVGETRPALTLILDGAPEDLLARRTSRGVSDAFETKDLLFHQKVREAFLQIARDEPERCIVLDALVPAEDLAQAALEAIETRWPVS